MARHIAVTRDPVGGLDDHLAVPGDHAGKREFAQAASGFRERDTALHHGDIDRVAGGPVHGFFSLVEMFLWSGGIRVRMLSTPEGFGRSISVRAYPITTPCVDKRHGAGP
jgi:hypothetical protein